jgi:hypothetical protein
MENAVRVDIEVLNSIVPEEAFEEIAGRKRESALREAREHPDLVFIFLHWVRISGGGSPHINLLLPDKSAVEKGQQILGLHLRLFPLAAWIWPRWRHRRRCPRSSRGGLVTASLLPGDLHRLGR